MHTVCGLCDYTNKQNWKQQKSVGTQKEEEPHPVDTEHTQITSTLNEIALQIFQGAIIWMTSTGVMHSTFYMKQNCVTEHFITSPLVFKCLVQNTTEQI